MEEDLQDNEIVGETLADLVEIVEELQETVDDIESYLEEVPKVVMGPMGPKGEKGDSIKGDKGATGSKGEKGDKGDKGDSGTNPEIDYPKIIEELKLEVKPIVYEVVANNRGGGNANRNIQVSGVNVLQPFTDINIIAGTGLTITTSANQTTKYTDMTFAASSSGGSGYQAPLSGGLTGTNTWTTAPNIIVVDGVPKQAVSTDGTVNWTGTTTTVLSVVPNFDIFATA